MKSLNETKGTTINDIEITIKALKKLLKTKIKENPKAGYIMAKGEENEKRLRYSDMLSVLNSLEVKLALDGCFSFGVCKTCSRFNSKTSSTGYLGTCGKDTKHEYDSCSRHSFDGGGFGL